MSGGKSAVTSASASAATATTIAPTSSIDQKSIPETSMEAKVIESVLRDHGPSVPVCLNSGSATNLDRKVLSLCTGGKGGGKTLIKCMDALWNSEISSKICLEDGLEEIVASGRMVQMIAAELSQYKKDSAKNLMIASGGGLIVYRYNSKYWALGVMGVRMALNEFFVCAGEKIVRWSDKKTVELSDVKPEDKVVFGATVDEMKFSVVASVDGQYVLRRGAVGVHAGVVGGFNSSLIYVSELHQFSTKRARDEFALLRSIL